MKRGARGAYRRVPRDAPDPPWSLGTNLGEESTESDRCCSSKSKIINFCIFFWPVRFAAKMRRAPTSAEGAPAGGYSGILQHNLAPTPGPVGAVERLKDR